MEDIVFKIYMFVFWGFWLFIAISMFQDSLSCGRHRPTDKQLKELDELFDKWDREDREAKQAEKPSKQEES